MVAADSTDDDRNHYSVVCIYRVEKREDNEKSRKNKATKNNLLLVGQKWNIPAVLHHTTRDIRIWCHPC